VRGDKDDNKVSVALERVMVMTTRRTSDKVVMVSVAMMTARERKVMNWS
jgi:hypothetical protein